MYKLTLILCLSCFSVYLNAQFIERYDHFQVQWGEMNRFGGNVKGFFDVDKTNFSVIVDRSPFNVLGSKRSKIRIKNYLNFKLKDAGDVLLRGQDKRVRLLGVLDIGNHAVAFTSRRNIWKRSHTNFFHKFNHFNTNETILGEEFSKYIYPYGFNFTGQIDFTASENEKYGAAFYIIPSRIDEYISMGFLLFDDQNHKIKQKIHLLPYKQYEITIRDQFLTDQGDYFLIAEHYFRRDPFRNWSRNNRSSDRIKILHATDDQFEELPLNQENFVMKSLALDMDQDGYLVGSGFYADIINGNVRGTFFLKYDVKNKKLITLQKNTLSQEMISQESIYFDRNILFSNRTRFGRSLNNFNQFTINFFKPTADGGYIAVAEQVEVEFKSTDQENSETRRTNYDEYYFHNDLIVFKMNAKGGIEWVDRIPKYQQSKNDGGYFLSTIEFLTDKKIHIFFNDHRKNYDEQGDFLEMGRLRPSTLTRRNNVVAGVTIDLKNGAMSRKRLEGRNTHRTVLVPKVSRPNFQDNTLLIYANHGRKHRFGKIAFF